MSRRIPVIETPAPETPAPETQEDAELRSLGDAELETLVRRTVDRQNEVTVDLLVQLAEVQRRRLYARYACDGLWSYCRRKLGLSESQASTHSKGAKVLLAYPVVEGYLRDRLLTLSAVLVISELFDVVGCAEDVICDAIDLDEGVRGLELWVRSYFAALEVEDQVVPEGGEVEDLWNRKQVAGEGLGLEQGVIEPVSADRYEIRLTASADLVAELRRAKSLLSHVHPAGRFEDLLLTALRDFNERAETKKYGSPDAKRPETKRPEPKQPEPKQPEPRQPETKRPEVSRDKGETSNVRVADEKGETSNVRVPAADERNSNDRVSPYAREAPPPPHVPALDSRGRRKAIPAWVRREVFDRDEGCCAFRDERGNRCGSRHQLEFDHRVSPHLGGDSSPANLELACRTHNRRRAERELGREFVQGKIGDRPA